MIQQRTITIEWKECFSYEDARDFYSCVYIHEWDGRAYYIGKVGVSVFGGNQRDVGGRRRAPRYGSSYRHWIDGCLEHGARLFIGIPPQQDIDDAENKLIALLQPVKNRDGGYDNPWITLNHVGDVPEYLKQ